MRSELPHGRPGHGSPPQREEALRGHAMVVQPCMQSIDDGLQPAPQVAIRGRIHLLAEWWVVRGVSAGQLERLLRVVRAADRAQ